MSDGLTDARAEAERLYLMPSPTSRGGGRTITFARQLGFVDGAEWATEREKARAEAAEARVAELESALKKWVDWYDGVQYADRDVPDMARESRVLVIAAPTTEAVTE